MSFSLVCFSKVVCKQNLDEVIYDILAGELRQLLNVRVLELLVANEQVFAKAGNSLNIQPETNA